LPDVGGGDEFIGRGGATRSMEEKRCIYHP